MKQDKTNVMRILDQNKVEYSIHTYCSDEAVSGTEVAATLGQNPEQVFKTLVTVGHSKEHYVCVIPVAEELDFKKAAKHFEEKNIEMIHAKDITSITGYIKGGCSPVGMKKPFKTAIDWTAELQETICVSGGKVGLQIELAPTELASLIGAEFVELTKE